MASDGGARWREQVCWTLIACRSCVRRNAGGEIAVLLVGESTANCTLFSLQHRSVLDGALSDLTATHKIVS